MATSQFALVPQPSLLSQLAEARMRTDALFDLLPPNSFYERPIPERHRMIFYLGHLEAFDWNLLSDRLGLKSQDQEIRRPFCVRNRSSGRRLAHGRARRLADYL